jgi:predicted small secreted protein
MPRTLFRHTIAAALLMALTLAGCSSTTPGAAGDGKPGGAGQVPVEQDRGERKISWVPPGPGTGVYGYGEGTSEDSAWQKAFDDRDCNAIAALGSQRGQPQLYTGLGAACRAVLDNDPQSWPAAEAALRHLARPADCLDQSAFRLLSDLVGAHRQAPHATIRIVDAPKGAGCASRGPTTPPTPVPTTESSPSSGDSTTPGHTARTDGLTPIMNR